VTQCPSPVYKHKTTTASQTSILIHVRQQRRRRRRRPPQPDVGGTHRPSSPLPRPRRRPPQPDQHNPAALMWSVGLQGAPGGSCAREDGRRSVAQGNAAANRHNPTSAAHTVPDVGGTHGPSSPHPPDVGGAHGPSSPHPPDVGGAHGPSSHTRSLLPTPSSRSVVNRMREISPNRTSFYSRNSAASTRGSAAADRHNPTSAAHHFEVETWSIWSRWSRKNHPSKLMRSPY